MEKETQAPQLPQTAVTSSVLTLKEIATYLPYALKIKVENDTSVTFTMSGIDCLLNAVNYAKGVWYESSSRIEDIKPILRPLSDLKNEIEINGEKLVPAVYLSLVGNYKNVWGFEFDGIHYWEILSCIKEVEKLYEWHFDVFNLIERGLAVSIHDVV